MKTIRFGVIGCGLMGREFASAAARWCYLADPPARPEIVAVCDTNEAAMIWFTDNLPSVAQATTDYTQMLANDKVEAVYCAVPHNLHQHLYCDIISAGKHLMGEKPFGIDKAANAAILQATESNPKVFARCSSEYPFTPAMQRICDMIDRCEFGQIIEVNTGFLHSSDLDPNKPINWKRKVEINGEYGVLGDLGMHALHVPLRAGWRAKNVRAVLSNIIAMRPDGQGSTAPCSTWDNATLLIEAEDPATGSVFPWTVKTQRIAPGHKNTWYCEVIGTKKCARYSSKNTNSVELLEYSGGEQAWQQIDMGQETSFKTVAGAIFEFGFNDCMLQMWAAFIYELVNGRPFKRFAGCVTPEETAKQHDILTAALMSQRSGTTIKID